MLDAYRNIIFTYKVYYCERCESLKGALNYIIHYCSLKGYFSFVLNKVFVADRKHNTKLLRQSKT